MAKENLMISIGGKTLIQSNLLLIPLNEEAIVSFEVAGLKSKAYITFKDSSATTESSIEVDPVKDGIRMIFNNWNNALGQALKEPADLLSLKDGTRLLMMCSNYRIVGTNQFHLQFLRSEKAP